MKNQNTLDIRLLNGAGKTNTELRRIAQPKGKNKKVTDGGIVFVTTREEVESGDLSRIIHTFGPMVPAEKLRQLHGKVHFTVDGYDDDPGELYEIPKVREFIFIADRFWGGWHYFASLRSDCLRMVACCLLDNLSATNWAGQNHHKVCVHQTELLAFFEQGLETAAYVHAAVGLSKEDGVKQLYGVINYLGAATPEKSNRS